MAEIIRTACARIPTSTGQFQLCHYANQVDQEDHLAVVMGDVAGQKDVLVRVHSECFTGDVLGSLRCDCGEQLQRAMELIAEEGSGVIVYLRQEGRGIGLEAKLRAYNLQDDGYDTVEANLLLGHQADEREYWAAAGILNDLGVRSIRLMTNNPTKIESLTELGIEVTDRIALQPSINTENVHYLDTKVRRMRHMLALSDAVVAPGAGNEEALELAPVLALQAAAHALQAERGRPAVTLSYAQTVDGCIAARRGEPFGISGPESLRLTHALRAAHDAVLVGVETAIADDPRLDVRLVRGPTPVPVILDSQLRTPTTARVFDAHARVLIMTTQANAESAAARQLSKRGATVLGVPAGQSGRPDLTFTLAALDQNGIRTVMVEGGAEVLHAFLDEGMADYAVITLAPTFLNGFSIVRPQQTEDAPRPRRMHNVVYEQVGEDLVIWGQFVDSSASQTPEISTHETLESSTVLPSKAS
jgi:GTP cyclohydrolase II